MRGWTDVDQKTVLTLWDEGHSATTIARMIGNGKTRNAVIGLIYRAGKSGQRLPSSRNRAAHAHVRRAKPPVERRSAPRAPRPRKPTLAESIGCGQDLLPPAEMSAPNGGVTFEQLDEHHCRWPYGDPGKNGFHYCGEHRLAGTSWCLNHARRAFDLPKIAKGKVLVDPAAPHVPTKSEMEEV